MKGHLWMGVVFAAACGRQPKSDVITPKPVVERQLPAVREPAMRTLAPGVLFREHTLRRKSGDVRVWIYAPAGGVSKARGLVLIAPAGSDLMTGMNLTEEDRAEHLPFVRAGYAVASFDVEGALPPKARPEQKLAAMRVFREARAGTATARAVLDYMLATYPRVNRQRIYASGHSSAGTLALLFAVRDLRIQAVVAFAPPTDLRAWLSESELAVVERSLPNYRQFLTDSAPLFKMMSLAQMPMFLFHAADDKSVSPAHSEAFFKIQIGLHPASRRVLVATGGHYKAMIQEGIPKALEWLGSLRPWKPPVHKLVLPGAWVDGPRHPEMLRFAIMAKIQSSTGRTLKVARMRLPKLDLSRRASREALADATERAFLKRTGMQRMTRRIRTEGDRVIIDLVSRGIDKRTKVDEVMMQRQVYMPGWNFTLMLSTPAGRYQQLRDENEKIIDSFRVQEVRRRL